jgi:AbrB family looped-hinge helix DNA binding protein
MSARIRTRIRRNPCDLIVPLLTFSNGTPIFLTSILLLCEEAIMQTTKLSSKGQVIIPKTLRTRYNLNEGQILTVIDTGDGILLKPSQPFKETELDQVAGMLKYSGKPVSLSEMEAAIKKGALERK